MKKKYTRMKDYVGEKFNKMLVLEVVKRRVVKCQCDCGTVKNCDWQDLKRNRIIGCGCQINNLELREKARERVYDFLEKGIFKKGGDNYPKEDREFRYILKRLKDKNRKKCYLTLEDLKNIWNKQNGICPYSKIKLKLPTHSNPNPDVQYYMASVDRIDSSKPYIKDNIQFVSRSMNYAKNVMSHEQTLEFIKLIIENNKSGGGES